MAQEQNNGNPGLPKPVREVADAQNLGQLIWTHTAPQQSLFDRLWNTQKYIFEEGMIVVGRFPPFSSIKLEFRLPKFRPN